MSRYNPETHQVRVVFHRLKYGSLHGPDGEMGFFMTHDVYRVSSNMEWNIGAPHSCFCREDAVQANLAFDQPVVGWVNEEDAVRDHYGDVDYPTQGIYTEIHFHE